MRFSPPGGVALLLALLIAATFAPAVWLLSGRDVAAAAGLLAGAAFTVWVVLSILFSLEE